MKMFEGKTFEASDYTGENNKERSAQWTCELSGAPSLPSQTSPAPSTGPRHRKCSKQDAGLIWVEANAIHYLSDAVSRAAPQLLTGHPRQGATQGPRGEREEEGGTEDPREPRFTGERRRSPSPSVSISDGRHVPRALSAVLGIKGFPDTLMSRRQGPIGARACRPPSPVILPFRF